MNLLPSVGRLTTVCAGLAFAASLSLATAQAAPPPAAGSAAGTGGLNPALAAAFTLAQADARREGTSLTMTSGYRSPAEQEQLWQDGLRTYGSPERARRWVLPPAESAHVRGQAIDVGPLTGARWLQRNGNRYGLCQRYLHEWWHFELMTFPGAACPPSQGSTASHSR